MILWLLYRTFLSVFKLLQIAGASRMNPVLIELLFKKDVNFIAVCVYRPYIFLGIQASKFLYNSEC